MKKRNNNCIAVSREDVKSFTLPARFLFGVANSPYHVEGGYNRSTGPYNNWASWEQGGRIEVSDDANDFWNRYDEHIEKAKSLGMNAFRMGFEWARVQPAQSACEGTEPAWDRAAFDRYAAIVRAVIAAGMQPIITLHHFTHPAWCGPDLWLNDALVGKFIDYCITTVTEINVRLVFEGTGPIMFFVVINEPNICAADGYIAGTRPPGKKNDFASATRAWDAMMAAYCTVYDKLHDLYEDKGWGKPQVGFNIFSLSVYELDKYFYDLVRAPSLGIARDGLGAYLRTMRKDWNRRHRQMLVRRCGRFSINALFFRIYQLLAGMLFRPLRLGKTIEALYASSRARKLDYLAIDVYNPFVIGLLYDPSARRGRRVAMPSTNLPWWEWPFHPEEYADVMRAHNRDNTELPLYMIENGIGHFQPRGEQPMPRPDGMRRDDYLRATIAEVVKGLKEGIPLKGYLYWTLTDNYEWGCYALRLGLLEYDYAHGTIADTDAFGHPTGAVFKEIIAALKSGEPARIGAALWQVPPRD